MVFRILCLFLFIAFIVLPVPVGAQYFESGQDPAFLKWKQIDSPHFKVIYPEDFSAEAQRMANILEYAYDLVPATLNHDPKKISVIIHNYSSRSNGFVAWAPKRMEIFPTPAPDSNPQDELEQLALHELRHVVQIDKLNQGFTKVLSYILGQQAVGGISVMLPIWFLEGDAVLTETSLSKSGRGRLPYFEKGLRALSLEQGEVFKYDKGIFGSYKDYVPDYYEVGYKLVSHSRNLFGKELWENALNKTGKMPYTINPVNLTLRKYCNLTKKRLYDSTFRDLKKLWIQQDEKTEMSVFDTINNVNRKSYTSYRFPQYLNDSTMLVEKSGMDQIRKLISIDRNGNEKKIHTPGFYTPLRFSLSGNLIVWAESINDPRWENRSYSVIKKFDLRIGEEIMLTNKSRYFAPAVSPDGLRIATIDITTEDQCFLAVLDAKSGEVMKRLYIDGNNSLHMPQWLDDHTVLVIVVDSEGKSIRSVNLQNGEWSVLLPPSFHDIRNVVSYEHYILYHSTYSGIDNIYALDLTTNKKYQVTSSRFGAYDVCISPLKDKLLVSDYTSSGYNLLEMKLNPAKWLPFEQVKDHSVKDYEPLIKDEKGLFETKETPQLKYDEKPFRKVGNLFGFHSWMPFYFDYEDFSLDDKPISLGATLLSQNKLSTMVSSLGYYYKNNEHHLITRFTYKGWYPVFDLFWDYGGVPQIIADTSSSAEPLDYSGRKSDLNLRMYIPLNFTRNKFIRGLYPEISGQYSNTHIYNYNTASYDKGRLYMNYRLYFYNYLKLSSKEIKPRWGQVIDLNYTNAPFNTENYGSIYSVLAGLYIPGILKHHSIYIRGGIEKQQTSKYIYMNHLSFPNGYKNRVAEEMKIIKADYYLPLFYPEWNLGSFIYIPRFYLNIFYNYSKSTGNYFFSGGNWNYNPDEQILSSMGGKISMDFFALRFPFPLNVGVQYSYMPAIDSYDISYTFGISFSGFTVNK